MLQGALNLTGCDWCIGTLEHVPLGKSGPLVQAQSAQHMAYTGPATQSEDATGLNTSTRADGLTLDPLAKAIERAMESACQVLQQVSMRNDKLELKN